MNLYDKEMQMEMFKALKLVSDLLINIEEVFKVKAEDVKFGCDDRGAIITVEKVPSALATFTSEDFEHFCRGNKLHGIIFFTKNNTVQFLMSALTHPGNFEAMIPVRENGTITGEIKQVFPWPNEVVMAEMRRISPPHVPIGAVKEFREQANIPLAEAKAAIEHFHRNILPTLAK